MPPHPNSEIFVFTRNPEEQEFARSLGAAWAVGVPAAGMARAIGDLPGAEHRQTVSVSDLGFAIVDDTYNSNPAGARSALAALVRLGSGGRRALVRLVGCVCPGRAIPFEPGDTVLESPALTPGILERETIFWPCADPDDPGTPILYADAMRTPTLIEHQENDDRCPIDVLKVLVTCERSRDLEIRRIDKAPGQILRDVVGFDHAAVVADIAHQLLALNEIGHDKP